jgi:hypothetical protein
VDNWSPALDLRILWRTALTVNRGEPPVHVDTLNIQRAHAEQAHTQSPAGAGSPAHAAAPAFAPAEDMSRVA